MPGLVHFNNKTFRRNRGRLQKHRDFLHAMDAKVIVVAEQGHSIQGIMTAPVFNEKPIFLMKSGKTS